MMTYRSTGITVGAIAFSVSLFACNAFDSFYSPRQVAIHTDSAEIGVGFIRNTYSAKIGFAFVNDIGTPLSKAGCHGPGMPDLEKNVNGSWVAAYYPIYLACLTSPDFVVLPGETYRSAVDFVAFEPGNSMVPELLVKSIDGAYRLHWKLTVGENATAKDAKQVDIISNEFRMVLRQ